LWVKESGLRSVQPFLMFQGNAEAAMSFYVSLFPHSRITDIARYPPGDENAEKVVKATFTLGNQSVMCIDSPVKHDFTFTPAFSFFVDCESEEQIRKLFAALSAEGAVLMPLDNYGFSKLFGWMNDRFGVSWQLNLE
jgi:predicted 3-demethylubiquinone-9 3-methyltransferase (glyoxalase superfamily)